mmetsp:Transcript_36326/g.112404  ORF Transcript_36326/g.112404 Transcript_36326/m.112404 type:complete len:207 (-) Transcript_36326:253-873(-)
MSAKGASRGGARGFERPATTLTRSLSHASRSTIDKSSPIPDAATPRQSWSSVMSWPASAARRCATIARTEPRPHLRTSPKRRRGAVGIASPRTLFQGEAAAPPRRSSSRKLKGRATSKAPRVFFRPGRKTSSRRSARARRAPRRRYRRPRAAGPARAGPRRAAARPRRATRPERRRRARGPAWRRPAPRAPRAVRRRRSSPTRRRV